MAPKKSLKDRRAAKLQAQAEEATKAIRAANVSEFTRSWLAQTLKVTEREAAQVASNLKKSLVLFGENKRGEDEMSSTLYRVRPPS